MNGLPKSGKAREACQGTAHRVVSQFLGHALSWSVFRGTKETRKVCIGERFQPKCTKTWASAGKRSRLSPERRFIFHMSSHVCFDARLMLLHTQLNRHLLRAPSAFIHFTPGLESWTGNSNKEFQVLWVQWAWLPKGWSANEFRPHVQKPWRGKRISSTYLKVL